MAAGLPESGDSSPLSEELSWRPRSDSPAAGEPIALLLARAAVEAAAEDVLRFALHLLEDRGILVGKILELLARHLLADEPLDGVRVLELVLGKQCERVTLTLRPAGAPDPVHVVLRVLGRVVVDH